MGLRGLGLGLVTWCGVGFGLGQAVLQSKGGVEARETVKGSGVPALTEAVARASVRLVQAGEGRGEVWLEVSARAGEEKLTLRVPLSSTEDAYGESRECVVKVDGRREFVFSAGLDERNYAAFKLAEKDKGVELLVNKYLCRAMAAPFDCAGKPVRLTGDWSRWTLGEASAVTLASVTPATLDLGMLALVPGPVFDPGRCAVIAPSNGVCCVGGKTTDWHCGGRPEGGGWHQVSGDCWHRETGGSCKD